MGIKRLLGIGSSPSPTELLIRAATLLIVKEFRKLEAQIMSTLDDVKAKVAEQSSVVASAVTFIDGLKVKLEAAVAELKAGGNPAALKEIVDALESDKNKLAEAIKENTIAEIEPAPAPVEEPAPVVEEPAPAPVEAPVLVEEPAPAEPAPAEPAEVKLDQWGNPL